MQRSCPAPRSVQGRKFIAAVAAALEAHEIGSDVHVAVRVTVSAALSEWKEDITSSYQASIYAGYSRIERGDLRYVAVCHIGCTTEPRVLRPGYQCWNVPVDLPQGVRVHTTVFSFGKCKETRHQLHALIFPLRKALLLNSLTKWSLLIFSLVLDTPTFAQRLRRGALIASTLCTER